MRRVRAVFEGRNESVNRFRPFPLWWSGREQVDCGDVLRRPASGDWRAGSKTGGTMYHSSIPPPQVNGHGIGVRFEAGPFSVLVVGQAGGCRKEPHLILLVETLRSSCGLQEATIVACPGDDGAVLRANRVACFHDVFIN